jgi:hypothetical protein
MLHRCYTSGGALSNEEILCPFCGQNSTAIRHHPTTGAAHNTVVLTVDCHRCGPFVTTKIFCLGRPAENRLKGLAHLLSGYIREQKDSGASSPPIIDDIDAAIALAKSMPRSIPDRSRKILRWLYRNTSEYGQWISIDPEREFPRGYAVGPGEFSKLIKYLQQRGLIEVSNSIKLLNHHALSADGFAELDKRASADSAQAFVAMWFDDSMDPAYVEAIEPTVRACGYDPIKVNLQEFNDDIVAHIMATIRESRFVISEFTGHRNGVYFEAGFGLGLGIPVIFVCRKDHADKTHFDTEHFNYVRWESHDELARKLKDRIIGTIGRGPHASKSD